MKPIYFIVNNTAGTGMAQARWKSLADYLKKRGISFKVYETKYKGHATELAEKISSLQAKTVSLIVFGGDGTINEVLNGIQDFDKVRLGVISSGSGNDFSNGIGISGTPVERLETILQRILEDSYQEMDLGEVSSPTMEKPRIFGISSGLGMDAIVCKEVQDSHLKKILNRVHLGKLSYVLMTVYTLFSMETVPMTIDYQKYGETIKTESREKLIFLAAMNLYAEGGGVPMAPKASCTDGMLSFSGASDIPKWKTFFCLPVLIMAKHERIRGFDISDAESAVVRLQKPVVLHADGEYCGDVTEAVFTCRKKLLKLLW